MEKHNHKNFYCKSGFSFAPFCGILRFFRLAILPWLGFYLRFASHKTQLVFPLSAGHPLLYPYPAWTARNKVVLVAASIRKNVCSHTQRRQVVPPKRNLLLATPCPLLHFQPLHLGQGSGGRRKETESSWHRNAKEEEGGEGEGEAAAGNTQELWARVPHEWLSKASRTRKARRLIFQFLIKFRQL